MEKNTMITLHKQGKAIKEISRITGYSKNTIKKYIREYDGKIS